MNAFKILLLICCILTAKTTFAQTPQAIETDLLKSFKKISFWDGQKQHDVNAYDSLEKANDRFSNKLKIYTQKYPATLNAPFTSLKKERLDILTSTDGLFRIYAWETWEGGTMRDFANLLQYKRGDKTVALLLTSTNETYIPFYKNLYTFKTGSKTYYLGVYGTIYSTKDAGTGIKVFTIENGKLNDDVKLFKTGTGLKNKIYYDYDFFSVVDIPFELRPTITFDAASQTIKIPLINQKGAVTKKFITYKFTGQYFEKAVNLAK